MERFIAFTYKNGRECSHRPHIDSEDEWWIMVRDLTLALNGSNPGVFITKSPFGIHRLSEVVSVHFGDVIPPQENTVPMGFIKE